MDTWGFMGQRTGLRSQGLWIGAAVVVIACVAGLKFLLSSSNSSSQFGSEASGWALHQDVDKLTGERSGYAEESVAAGDEGSFLVRADCGASILTFTINYSANNSTNDQASRLNWDSDQNGNFVSLRVKIDSGEVKNVRSESKFSNQASIFFYDEKGTSSLMSSQKAVKEAGAFGELAATLSMVAVRKAGTGTIDDFNSAKSIKVEVPLASGQREVVDISPKEASLKPLLAMCVAGGLTALGNPDAATIPPPPALRSVCVAGTDVYAKPDAVVFRAGDLTKPVNDLVSLGSHLSIEPTPDSLPPETCLAKHIGLIGNGIEYVVSRGGLQSADEYHSVGLDRIWTGDSSDFGPALQSLASKYASIFGFNPRQYQEEFRFIEQLANRCTKLKRLELVGFSRRLDVPECTTMNASDITADVLHKHSIDAEGKRDIVIFPNLSYLGAGTGGWSIRVDLAPNPGAKSLRNDRDDFVKYGIIDARFPAPN
jgi:hypothetical protein